MSGCGWLIPYHIGVLKCLVDAKMILKEGDTVFSGVSGGAIVIVGFSCGLNLEDVSEMLRCASDRVRRDGRFVGRVGATLKDVLNDVLPENAHELARGKCNVGVLTATCKYKSFSEFESKQDLIDACLASSHIPIYMDGRFLFTWRKKRWFDGGLLDVLPPDSGEEIKSLPYPILAKLRRDRDRIVTPTHSTFSLFRELLPYSFVPPPSSSNGDWFSRLDECGRKDTERFLVERDMAT